MPDSQNLTDILIIGAGMCGLSAAAALLPAGRRVLVIDKGRGVGGRMATRRIGAATLDHGAQFVTARTPRFKATIQDWLKQGAAAEWFRGSPGEASGGHPRWRGAPSMTAIPKYLARGLDVRLEQHVTHVRRQGDGWMVVLQNGATLQAGAVLLTPPVPQALALLEAGEVALEPAKRAQLEDIDYEPCLAVMAVLDGPTRLPPPGWLAPEEEPIAWLADNQQKGISTVPAVTIHATPAFSRAVWHQDRQASGEALLQAARDWLGAAVTDFQVHGWRYSKPLAIEKSACLVLNDSPPLLLAGDAFGGGRVEGAALSGWAAAELLEQEV